MSPVDEYGFLLDEELEGHARLEIDSHGFTYVLVRIEGLTARHYPRKNGIPPAAQSDPHGADNCIFLEGLPCYIV